jgi:hypothetical protein
MQVGLAGWRRTKADYAQTPCNGNEQCCCTEVDGGESFLPSPGVLEGNITQLLLAITSLSYALKKFCATNPVLAMACVVQRPVRISLRFESCPYEAYVRSRRASHPKRTICFRPNTDIMPFERKDPLRGRARSSDWTVGMKSTARHSTDSRSRGSLQSQRPQRVARAGGRQHAPCDSYGTARGA